MLAAPSARKHVAGTEGLVQITPFCYHTVSAVMLPVGTQPLDSQHPPLAAPPLGSANKKKAFPPRWLQAKNLQVKKDVRRKAPGREGDLIWVCCCCCCWRATVVLVFRAARRNREGTNSGERYAGVPSLSAFLNPPTLRPSPSQALSHAGPHQLCTRLLLWLF